MGLKELGIRGKLILIFVLIKVVPLVALAWFAWDQVGDLGKTVANRTAELTEQTKVMVGEVGNLATEDSIKALDVKAREAIERLTTDTARQVASFLYDRDRDVLQAAELAQDATTYRRFLAPLKHSVTYHAPWVYNEDTNSWVPAEPSASNGTFVQATNADNTRDFHSRPPEIQGILKKLPLYHEMTFVGLDGRERLKVSMTDLLSGALRDISKPENTYCRAEHYFEALQALKPGEVYVSEVIGPYVPSKIIGPYTRPKTTKAGLEFTPEESGYAGKENPVGKRFQGIIRWAAPVVRNEAIVGYVTLALDHTHVMEFTDHVVPTEERYSPISDAATGNYAFMWDYKGRNISHPRDYFITGYDPETGEPAVPWLDTELYDQFVSSGLPISEFLKTAPTFHEQSLKNKPAPALIKQGTIALDGRYLNFAPQCTGWQNLTQNGGSGSLVIFWSGLWKLSTAAAIPYHTGIYGNHPRGFGFVTIGANVHEFHRAATETAEKIDAMVAGYETELATQAKETKQNLTTTLAATARNLALSTIVMAFVVILIAIWMASTLTKKITSMIAGVRRFQQGEMNARLEVGSTDEMGQLSQAFNDMSNSVQTAFHDLTQAESKFRNIVEHATVGIFQSTMEGRLISVNPAMARMLGYDSPDQMTSEIKDLATQFYAEQDHRAHFLEQLHVEDSLNEEEFLAYRRDGTIGSFTSNSRLVRDQAGKALYIEGMLLDITDRKEKERAQRERNMAESANLAKSEFLARMSHEIRTPMNAVIGVADLLEEYELDREQKILVNLLKTSGDNLLALIDDILDLSKIEAGKTILEDTPFDLREEVASLCSLLAHRAFEKNLEFDYDIGPHVPSLVLGDHLRLRQVLTNLIGNAIKFTFEGEILLSVYTLEATPKRVQLVFKVTDTGIGIPKDKLAHVFESFGQADSSTTRSSSGTGLGLTISQKLVNLMGGDIQVQSRLGEGSVFSFSLPMLVIPDSLRPAKLPPAPLNGLTILVADGFTAGRERVARILTRSGAKVTEAASRREALAAVQAMSTAGLTFDVALIGARLGDLSGFEMARTLISQAGMAGRIFMLLTTTNLLRNADILRELGQPRYLTKPINEHDLLTNLTGLAQKSTPSDHPQFGSDLKTKQMDKRLLVVDDAEDNRVILNQYLKTSGYKYTMAENGNTALQHFRDTPYDLVILDMQMPTMDGYTTATKMREMEREEKRSPVPIIALTAHAMADDRQKCLDAGCSDYLTKPIRKAALLEALVKHLEEQTNS